MADFNKAYKATMGHEGGYVDDPADKGGETYKGIARRYNPGWGGWKQIDPLFKIMNILQGMHYINYMQKSPIQERFARGWLKRVDFVKERHLAARV